MRVTLCRASAVFLAAALITAANACRPKPASVEELYTTRVLGLSYLQRNQLPEAESEFKKLTELAPDDPFGHATLGLTYLQAGRYAEAEKQLRRARELDPASTEVGLALARLYSLTGRSSDARTMLERLRRDSTSNARVLYALAELESQQPDSASARRYEARLRDVLAVAPSNLAVRLKLVDVLTRRGEADSAVHHLEEVRRIPPEPPKEARIYLDSSIQLLRAGRLAESRATLDRFFRLMEVTAPYQSSLDDVKWTEGPIAGRPVLSFAPRYFLSLPRVRERAAVELAKFVDATSDAGLPSPVSGTGNVVATERQQGPMIYLSRPGRRRCEGQPRISIVFRADSSATLPNAPAYLFLKARRTQPSRTTTTMVGWISSSLMVREAVTSSAIGATARSWT
jgi:Flp pilus assembly protein TadD